jgi:hypothetical protein
VPVEPHLELVGTLRLPVARIPVIAQPDQAAVERATRTLAAASRPIVGQVPAHVEANRPQAEATPIRTQGLLHAKGVARIAPTLTPDAKSAVHIAPSLTPSAKGAARIAPSLTPDAKGAVHIAPSLTPGVKGAARIAPSLTPGVKGAARIAPSLTPGAKSAARIAPSLTPGAKGAVRIAPSLTPGAKGAVRIAPSLTPGVKGVARIAPGLTLGVHGPPRVEMTSARDARHQVRIEPNPMLLARNTTRDRLSLLLREPAPVPITRTPMASACRKCCPAPGSHHGAK